MGRALEKADAQSLTMERDSAHFANMIMFLAKIICLAFSRALCGSCPPQLRHERVC
jgi:adenine-specific DNA glycosylase